MPWQHSHFTHRLVTLLSFRFNPKIMYTIFPFLGIYPELIFRNGGNILKLDQNNKSYASVVAVLALSLLCSTPLLAGDYSFSGEANTILRMRTTIDKKNIYPAYEYLRLNMTDIRTDGSAVSFYLGAWGRADLADKSGEKYTDSDLQYAYLSYRGAKNNTVVNLGRQFVTEGVAAEKLDGLYLRNDFAAGISAAAFAGKSVITEPTYKGGNFIYGTRLTQSMPKYYTVGVSALKSDTETKSRYREEMGADIWIHPIDKVDLTGRSSYNSITYGWMEHAYTLSVTPMESLRISADVSSINYRDYFFNMTTTALSFSNMIISPNEELTAAGVAVSYVPIKNLSVAADFKRYNYKIAGNADYYGGKATYSLPDSFSAGVGIHRMQGTSASLRYTETRAFASKKLGKADLTVDFHNVWYDKLLNGVRNVYVVTGAAGYQFNEKLTVGADLEYSRNPDFDDEVRGLVKITYAFDTKRSVGGGKSEK
jgi:hypothetical protein